MRPLLTFCWITTSRFISQSFDVNKEVIGRLTKNFVQFLEKTLLYYKFINVITLLLFTNETSYMYHNNMYIRN